MHKNFLIAIVITTLFLGIIIQPAIAVNPISPDNEEDCSICPKVSKTYFGRLRSLINRIEILNNKILVMSKHNTEVAKEYQVLSNKIKAINEDISNIKLKDFPILYWLYTLILYFNFYFIVLPIIFIVTIIFYLLVVLFAIGLLLTGYIPQVEKNKLM